MPFVRQLRTNVEEGMTPGLMSALATVARQGPIALGDLAAAERVTPPMATKTAAALEERGLVERQPCADDKRVVRLELSAAGPRAPRPLARRGATPGWPSGSPPSPRTSGSALAEAVTVFEHLNRAGGPVTRFKVATRDTFRSLQHRNFRIFFITHGHQLHRDLDPARGPDPARLPPHRQRDRPRPAHGHPVRPDPRPRRLGRRRRRPLRQAPAS